MAWSPEDRRKFLSALDTTESRLLVFYKYLLYFLIVSVTLLAVAFHHSVAKDAFRDFLRLYGGILYLIFLAWRWANYSQYAAGNREDPPVGTLPHREIRRSR